MTDLDTLISRVRELKGPDREADGDVWRCIRARYRQIVAEGGYMLPQEVHDLDAGPSRIIQRS